jgi:tetratricopeptide (TPR) repeat protein
MVGPFIEFGEYDRIGGLFSGMTAGHPMYVYGLSMGKALHMDFAGAAEIIEDALKDVENPRQFELSMIAAFSVFAGDFDKARKYAELHDPDFAADADPQIDADNVADAIRYALILQQQGENRRADNLLQAALEVVRTLPRIGLTGHGIRDVQILALQRKHFEALAAFREAIDAGFRGTVASNGWPVSIDPYLDSIRNEPEFQAMIRELDDAIAEMHQRVLEAEESGNWDELRALVKI